MGSCYLGVIYAEVVFRETRIMARIMDRESYDACPPAKGIRFSCGLSRFLKGVHILLVLTATLSCQTVTQETLQEHIEDAAITSSVKSKFIADQSLNAVNVETVRNRVYLIGVVPTANEKQRARELAFKVVCVLTVVNDLEVQAGHSL
jgi:hyperosmotically inducible protein